MLTAFGLSILAVFLAEMGDKTQLLAMAFASRFKWYTVLWGVAVATLLNHFLAAVFGNFITAVIPIVWVKLLAAVTFLLFALWTLHDDTSPEDGKMRASPFLTVAIAFFIAEMGDKTQIMTMTLAAGEAAKAGGHGLFAKAHEILPVWCGTTVGMLLADSIGIIVGVVLHKRIPAKAIKWVAALTFAAFGLLGMHESLDGILAASARLHHMILLAIVPVLLVLMWLIARASAARAKSGNSPATRQCAHN